MNKILRFKRIAVFNHVKAKFTEEARTEQYRWTFFLIFFFFNSVDIFEGIQNLLGTATPANFR